MPAILRDGLDPRRRAGQAYGAGEYFGASAAVSLPYCKGGAQMIVFAVLTDPSGITLETEQMVVCHKPEHQLPLCTITFTHDRGVGANSALQAAAAAMAQRGASALGRRRQMPGPRNYHSHAFSQLPGPPPPPPGVVVGNPFASPAFLAAMAQLRRGAGAAPASVVMGGAPALVPPRRTKRGRREIWR